MSECTMTDGTHRLAAAGHDMCSDCEAYRLSTQTQVEIPRLPSQRGTDMTEQVVEDDLGRRTVFTGEKLVEETTDASHTLKPQWLEVDVWRTQAGSFVVQRTTRYRIRHLSDECARAEGYDLSLATGADTYPCPACNRGGSLEEGWSQDDRITVDVYSTPHELIQGFQNEGKFNHLSRTILAEISEQDDRVDAAWMTVRVP